MFVGVERPSQLHRSGMYSLPQHHDSVSLNRSDVVNSRYRMDDSLRDRNNYSSNNKIKSAIVPPEQKQPLVLSDKDYLYLRMLEEKRKGPGQSTMRDSRMADSRVMNNPEGGEVGKRDSLSRQMEEYEASRR